MKKWVKLILILIPLSLILGGTFIYRYMDEESFKIFVYSIVGGIIGFLWHYGKTGARLKDGGIIIT